MEDEFTVKDRDCLWCNKPLGRYSVQPRKGRWVHRYCDQSARSHNLARYIDLLEED